LNNEVQKFRKANKITQEDLAKMVNVTRQTIISIEQGKYIASLPLALKIAKVFNASVEDIFSLGEDD
jgi:putative transcriptional regulator